MTVNAGPVAAERAYAHTKAQIISGGLAGGQLVSEAKIGAELGISRTPVHEAFLRLDAEQLIELVSRKGAIIRPMTPSEATDVLAMRQGIESASAAQTFAAGGPDAEITRRIEENLRQQEAAVGAGDVAAFVDADDDFHALLIEASRNPLARQFYEQLRGRQQRLRTMYLRIDPGNLAASYADHRTLADCFVGGDRDGFTAALVAHLERYQGAI